MALASLARSLFSPTSETAMIDERSAAIAAFERVARIGGIAVSYYLDDADMM